MIVKRTTPAACLLVLAAIIGLSACGQKENGNNIPTAVATYRHAMDGAPTSLDPVHASNIYANFLAVNLFDTLYRYKYLARPYQLEPNLAEGMPQVSADGLIYTIRIKPGVHFIDDPSFPEGKGRAVRAEDFVYSLKRHFDPATRAQGAWLWQGRIVGLDEWKENGANYDQEVAGLVGYWSMEEGAGQVVESGAGDSLTGTLGGSDSNEDSDPIWSDAVPF